MHRACFFLVAVCTALTTTHTLEEARANPELFKEVTDLTEFNPWYHAGIALVMLYILLTGITSSISIVAYILGHKSRRRG
ncbi:unnamed protein product [Hydatigera taeniaeformis]|uniref:Cytochrome d ubiquinol oxidase subunit II n=1 Tax=Hydatigena taeniaeformis TaxID=6205 RepID=A0A0R3X9V3_HYDTA|nr:unnamed protein product [Hydatigera taeniaeformis]